MKLPWLALTGACLLVIGCKNGQENPTTVTTKPAGVSATTPKSTGGDKVQIKDIVVGKGDQSAASGDSVWVLYKGTLANGKVFQSIMDPDSDPMSFAVGMGQVIKGWDEGILGMKVGGKRHLHIPASLAYGEKGSPPDIPPNADLDFDIQLLGIVKVGEENVIDKRDIKLGTGAREVKNGDKVAIRYVGRLLNGKVFDDRSKGAPFEFRVGAGETLPAIDAGVRGMKAGGVRVITAPPMTAFALKPAPGVPVNSEVEFQVTLVSIK